MKRHEARIARALERMAERHARHQENMLDLLQEDIEQSETEDCMSVEGFLERLNAEGDAPG